MPSERLTSGVRAGLFIAAIIVAVGGTFAYQRFHEAKKREFSMSAKRAVLNKNWGELRGIAESWLKVNPTSNDAHLFLAEACVQTFQFDDAISHLKQVSQDHHGYLESLGAQAEILFTDLNQPFEAVELWRQMLDMEPSANVPHQRLIFWYAMTLQRQKMVQQILTAAKSKSEPPESYSYLVLTNDLNFSDGLATVTRWRTQYPDSRLLEVAQAVYAAKTTAAKSLPKFGSSTVMPGDPTLVERCVEKYPDDLELLSLLIEQSIFAGDVPRTARLLEQASPDAEHDSRFWRYRGWLFMSKQSQGKAEESFRIGLKLHPWDWRARMFLADVLRKQSQVAEAEQQAQLASTGKQLRLRILESPNAREIDVELIGEMLDYFYVTGPVEIQQALESRLGKD